VNFIDVLAGYDYAINGQNHYAKLKMYMAAIVGRQQSNNYSLKPSYPKRRN
jgi:hypothetical protein